MITCDQLKILLKKDLRTVTADERRQFKVHVHGCKPCAKILFDQANAFYAAGAQLGPQEVAETKELHKKDWGGK